MHSIGILGGTFDPVHFGHLRLGLEMRERLGLSGGVRLMPAPKPALRGAPGASPELRLEMLEAAVAGIDGLSVDSREFARQGTTYTLDTLQSLRLEQPGACICLIIGMDAFARLHRWHRWREITDLAHIAVARRPGSRFPDDAELGTFVAERAVKEPAKLTETPGGHVCLVETPLMDVSATYIRSLVKDGRNPQFLMPESVIEIIERHGMYRGLE